MCEYILLTAFFESWHFQWSWHCFRHCWSHMVSTNLRQQRQMGDGRKPQGKGLMSQFHCDNGARALGIVAIVHSHSVHQLTRKLHHVLSQSYWSWVTGPHGILTDEEVSLAIFFCERGPSDPGTWQLHHSNRNRRVMLAFPPITSWHIEVFCCFIQSDMSVSIQVFCFLFFPPEWHLTLEKMRDFKLHYKGGDGK